ncbi:class I SAM-dependent methyltransferase [Streptomyces anulatus]|uniref:class I SAM-dependent methyltransferase n=1 Tax=Streptomyces TaxID=1883 RepID=UPI001C5F0055|nr:class I SAM-dependent methyltransferase [Streptomyces anulatus]QYA95778.1 class I SAM-dependent methyltransferase [Streptomyces anulatus]
MTDAKAQPHGSDNWSERQIAYYRDRAGEYDDTYSDRMSMPRLAKALDALPVSGDVLELACGTGQWTRLLLPQARSLTALDAASEMLRRARDRMRGTATRFIEADIFEWEPDRQYDTVFFAFWLSHVPPIEMEPFWDLLRWALAPGGRVVFLDDSSAKAEIEERVDEAPVPTVRRTLSDGSRHVAVKVLRDPADLTSQLDGLGWDAHVETIDAFHLSGVARPREGS